MWLRDEAATLRVGAALAHALDELFECLGVRSEKQPANPFAARLTAGLHLHLCGGLGAGKTTLVRGLLRAMGVTGAVKSPTYTLVEPYQSAHWEVFHFDLYRLDDPEELELLGVRDYFRDGSLCVFEWPSKGHGALPAPSLIVTLTAEKEGRRLHIDARDAPGRMLKKALQERLEC